MGGVSTTSKQEKGMILHKHAIQMGAVLRQFHKHRGPKSRPAKKPTLKTLPDLFLRRLREGNSFRNFVERSILKLSLSKLCAVPFSLQNRAPFEDQRKGRKGSEKGGEEGAKRKKTRQLLNSRLQPNR